MTGAEERGDGRSSIDRRVDAIHPAELEGPVRSVLRDPSARVVDWRHAPVPYDFLNPSSGGVYRFAGTAQGDAGRASWALVLKVTRTAAALGQPSPGAPEPAETHAEAVRWDRELLAYETGFLAGLDGGLVAAACHGGARHDDGTAWLWLEDLGDEQGTWSLEQWAHVAGALGAFNGAYLAAGQAPEDGWLGRRWLRVWVTQITPFHFARSITPGPWWDEPPVRDAYSSPLRERLRRLWADREALLNAVEALPQTCSHLDAHRRNLFLRADGGQVVAIDWGLLGLAPPGEEIASTLVGTVASGEVAGEDAAALARVLYDGYLAGLRDAGWRADERDVRLAFSAAAALRAFSVLRLDVVGDPGRTRDEAGALLAGAAELAAVLVDLGDEARAMGASRV